MQRLLEKARAGDRQALADLLENHRSLIRSIVVRYTNIEEDRTDLTQDVIDAAYESFKSLRDGAAFIKWILNITKNLCNNWSKRERNNQQKTASLNDLEYQEGGSAQPIDPHACPEDWTVNMEITRYILNVLKSNCSGAEYNVMVRRWNEDEYSKIAAELLIDQTTARSYYHRGERKLWTCLLAEHRDFLGGEASIAEAMKKAEVSNDPKVRLTEEEKQAFQAGDKSKQKFASACIKVRLFLPLSVCLFLFFRSVPHG